MSAAESSLAVQTQERERIERSLSRLNRLARLLDDQFELPLVKYRVGLDPLLGLIPGGGDWVTWFVSLYILFEALRLRIPTRLLFGIGLNVTTDLILGYVPGVGDLADAVFKANRRSVDLITQHFHGRRDPRAPERITIPETALDSLRSGIERWPVALLLVVGFTILAAVPLALIWWALQGS